MSEHILQQVADALVANDKGAPELQHLLERLYEHHLTHRRKTPPRAHGGSMINLSFSDIERAQTDLQQAMGWPCGHGVDGFKENMFCAIVELTEALNELPWKQWKRYDSGEAGWAHKKLKVATELTDSIQFVFNAAIALGITSDDLSYALQAKWAENFDRIDKNEVIRAEEKT